LHHQLHHYLSHTTMLSLLPSNPLKLIELTSLRKPQILTLRKQKWQIQADSETSHDKLSSSIAVAREVRFAVSVPLGLASLGGAIPHRESPKRQGLGEAVLGVGYRGWLVHLVGIGCLLCLQSFSCSARPLGKCTTACHYRQAKRGGGSESLKSHQLPHYSHKSSFFRTRGGGGGANFCRRRFLLQEVMYSNWGGHEKQGGLAIRNERLAGEPESGGGLQVFQMPDLSMATWTHS